MDKRYYFIAEEVRRRLCNCRACKEWWAAVPIETKLSGPRASDLCNLAGLPYPVPAEKK